MSRRIMKTVGIIGAGAGGLCGARHVLAAKGMSPIIWEQSKKIGGTWVYTPEVGKDNHGLPIHSSMYTNLRTNLPKEVMAFPDYPFPEGEESFLHHTKVCQYLESYSSHFDINPHIKFSHHVERVSPVMKAEGPPAWDVSVRNLVTNENTTTTCDALLVCNGHYSIPRIPDIKSIDIFNGRKVHSHDYREPRPFKDMTVVILGAAASGLDICLEIATAAKKVFLSHNHPVELPSEFPANVQQVRGVVAATENGFILKDQTQIEADVILYCTGYEFSFPFLTEECGITIEDNIVKPLYKHLIHSTYPSMAFIGIPFLVCPFPLFDFQVQHFVATLTGKLKLPSSEEMMATIEDEMASKEEDGIPRKHHHKYGRVTQLRYMNEVVEEIGCPPVKLGFVQIISIVMMRLILDFTRFKSYTYKLTGADSFQEFREGRVINSKWDLFQLGVRGALRLLWRDFYRMAGLLLGLVSKKVNRMLKPKHQKLT